MDKREKMCIECMALGKLIYRSMSDHSGFRRLNECSGSNGWILAYLSHNADRDIFQKDIEEAFALSRSAVSKIITAMEKNGLIVRESVDHDARLKKLTLTDEAKVLEKTLEAEMAELWQRLTNDLTDDEIHKFTDTLKKIQKNFEGQEKSNA